MSDRLQRASRPRRRGDGRGAAGKMPPEGAERAVHDVVTICIIFMVDESRFRLVVVRLSRFKDTSCNNVNWRKRDPTIGYRGFGVLRRERNARLCYTTTND